MNSKMAELLQDIAANRARLMASIEGVSEQEAERPPGEGKWSVTQLIDHLLRSERSHLKLYQRKIAEAQQRRIEPELHSGSELGSLDHLREQFRLPREAPEFVRPGPARPVDDLRRDLISSRQQLIEAVEALSKYNCSQLSHPHPILGELNLYQWILVGGQHELRHAKQIEQIRSAFAAIAP